MVKRQFAQFLLLVGAVVMVLFLLSYAANQMNFWLFLGGAALLFWGWKLLVANPAEPRPKAERFRMVKKLSSRKKKEEKKDKKEKQENAET